VAYTPFDGPINAQLTPADLQLLVTRQVAEGWFIEYKREFPDNQKIGRSIASFANMPGGGWYFVGVEAHRPTNIATKICGYDTTVTLDPIDKIRNVVKTNLDPVPVFHIQIVPLGPGRAVTVVHVPGEQDTPFITKDGRVYRRVADSSDPVHESDRYALDELIARGRSLKERYTEFCQDERDFSQGENETIWLNIYISPKPLGLIDRSELHADEAMSDLLEPGKVSYAVLESGDGSVTGHMNFNHAQHALDSIILRNFSAGRLYNNTLTAELFTDGRSKLFIPVVRELPFPAMHIEALQSPQVRMLMHGHLLDTYEDEIASFNVIALGDLCLKLGLGMAFYSGSRKC
jgi:hypothetical protein